MRDNEKQWTIRFPLDLYALIAEQAKEQGRSFNAQVIWMLKDYLKGREKRDAREAWLSG